MSKKIEDISIAELGEVFPIILEESHDDWGRVACEEEMFLRYLLGDDVVRITHIGSTSVPGLLAKPTIDLLLEINKDANVQTMLDNMQEQGYAYEFDETRIQPGYMLMKGYTPTGFVGQAFHVHMRYAGDYDEDYFCRYLREHKDVADAYADLKRSLLMRFEHDREAYTQGKTEFCKKYTNLARRVLK